MTAMPTTEEFGNTFAPPQFFGHLNSRDRTLLRYATRARDFQWSAVVDGLKRELAEAEATRDACLSMAVIDKETTMTTESNRARLAGEIAVNGEPLCVGGAPSYLPDERPTPPRPDLSPKPDMTLPQFRGYELTGEFRLPRKHEEYARTYGEPGSLTAQNDHGSEPEDGPRWILRRRTPAPAATPTDAGEAKADDLIERLRTSTAGGDAIAIDLLREAAAEIERLRGSDH